MKYTIRKTETGWELVAADGTVVAAFTGPEEQSYHDAIAHLGALIGRERAALAEAAPAGAEGEPGLLPERWSSNGEGIAFCEALPGGRDFTNCTWSWRDPATGLVPLMLQTANEGGHWGAELAGFVEEFLGGGNEQVDAAGRFFDNEAGVQFRDILNGAGRFGVSVDPSEAVDVDEEFTCVAWDDEGFCIDGEWAMTFNSYEIAGLTGVPFPGFEDAAIKLAASRRTMFLREHGAIALEGAGPLGTIDTEGNVKLRPVSTGRWEASPARATLSIPTAPPRAWFELPEPRLGEGFLDGLGDDVLVEQATDGSLACPPVFLDSGLVYGHLTYKGQCHVGSPWGAGRCASAPESTNGYADFHGAGHVICDDGSELSTGLLHVGCEHSTAMDVRGVRDAAAHAGLAFAQVRVVDGEYGPWMCGSLLPTVTEQQLVKLRALTLSGEWAPELGAVIAVNDGGLPLKRAVKIAASNGSEYAVAERVMRASMRNGELTKLIGGNAVRQCPECAKRRAAQVGLRVDSAVARRLDAIEGVLQVLEVRTRHLRSAEAEATRSQLGAIGSSRLIAEVVGTNGQ